MRRWLGPADALLQQAAWWMAVWCASRGETSLAALAGAATVAVHLVARPGERALIGRAAAAAALYGLATDTLLSASGLIRFAGAGLAGPAWMAGLWAAFGVALTASLRGALRWPASALAAGAAVAGPLAYRAGAALGALSLGERPGVAAAAIAAQWAIGIPLLARAVRSPANERAIASGQRAAPEARPVASAGGRP